MLILWISVTALVALIYSIVVVKLLRSQLGVGGIRAFLIVGGALAVTRIGLLWFLYYRFQTHRHTASAPLAYILLPENAVMYGVNIHNTELHAMVLTILLAIGSFLWLSPLLLIGAKRKFATDPKA